MDNFISDINRRDIDLNKKLPNNTYIYAVKAIVEWGYELEARSWGIKGFDFYVEKVGLCWTIETWNDISQDDIETEHELTVENNKSGWAIDIGTDTVSLAGSICPQNIEVNFDDKKITINF